jgi:hypothetical protein
MAIVFFNALLIMRLQNWQKKIDGQDAPSYPIRRWHPAYIDYLAAFYDAHYQYPTRRIFIVPINTNRSPKQ